MITQIYSIQTPEEAQLCIDCGVDSIGIAAGVGTAAIPAAIPFERGRKIFSLIGDRAQKVALTVADNEEDIYPVLDELAPDVLHICGNRFFASADFARRLRERYPLVKLLQAIAVTGSKAVEEAVHFSEFCDFLILDSVKAGIDGIGAAGLTHDWSISKRIVEALEGSPCKVILAGGLGPDNVSEAIRKVRPYGVDSFTKTSKDGRKDGALIAAFVKNAQAAAKELSL
ncbi:MAG: phosphoribosylanthranilate isomerase [Clostridia bacterium]|nr:phosphoribosylanthranilate isomerase [Clostridia bacterium]